MISVAAALVRPPVSVWAAPRAKVLVRPETSNTPPDARLMRGVEAMAPTPVNASVPALMNVGAV